MSSRYRILAIYFAVITFSLLFPSLAEADVGVPLIFLTYPAMLIALLPIIVIETIVFVRVLRFGVWGLGWRVAIANIASTVVGFPLAWFAWLVVEMSVVGGLSLLIMKLNLSRMWPDFVSYVLAIMLGAWLGPGEQDFYWMVPAAAMVGLIPAFFLSVWIEGHLLKRLLRGVDSTIVWNLTWKANIVSYILLIGVAGTWLLHSVATKSFMNFRAINFFLKM